MKTSETRVRRFIDAAAALYELPAWEVGGATVTRASPGELLEAMIMTESSGRPAVSRYEPHLDKASADDPDQAGVDDGLLEDDKSYGPMQVLGLNVRSQLGISSKAKINYGFMQDFGIGSLMGLLWLLAEVKRAQRTGAGGTFPRDIAVAIARYNGGPRGNPGPTGVLRQQEYVNKVVSWIAKVQKDRRARQWVDVSDGGSIGGESLM